jgi:hypothetical protein
VQPAEVQPQPQVEAVREQTEAQSVPVIQPDHIELSRPETTAPVEPVNETPHAPAPMADFAAAAEILRARQDNTEAAQTRQMGEPADDNSAS